MRHSAALLSLLGTMLAIGPCATALAEPPAAVLVTTAPAQQGTMPNILTAFGEAAPAQGSGSVISLPQDGRVAALLVTQGERVAAGTRLLVFNQAASVTSTYSQAVTSLGLTQTERAHTAELLAQHLATRDQLAQADKSVSDARAALDALVRQGADRPTTEIRAPFDAIVVSIPVSPGDRVAAGAALMTLARLDDLVVTAGIDPTQYDLVRPGMAVRLSRVAEDPAPGPGPSLAGTVLRLDGMVNPKTRLLDVDVSLPKTGAIAGEAFRADITVGQLQGWIVPHDAVLSDEKGFYLYQVAGSHAARVDVQVLATHGGRDAVSGHVDGAEQVIVSGATQLQSGDPVRLASAAPSSP